jgi:hypothetical protein
MSSSRSSFLFAAVLLVIAPPSSQAAVIGVNFVGGQGGPGGADSVTGTAGVIPAANWNNEAPASIAAPVTIFDSTGVTSASLQYSAPNNWAATGGTPGGGSNASLMSGYLDNFQNVGSSIVVTGLGAAYTVSGYSVIVYQNSDSAGSWGYTVADNAGHTGTRYGRQLTGSGGSYPLVGTDGFVQGLSTNSAGDATASNYIRIDGLTGTSFTITGSSGTTGDGRVRPNGFQIIAVPEPAAAGFALLAGSILLLRRRRA